MSKGGGRGRGPRRLISHYGPGRPVSYRKVHLAASLPNGGVIPPMVHGADGLKLTDLARWLEFP